MKAIKAREVERALGGHLQCGSLQFTGSSASQRRPMAGQSGRAYNSAYNWPGAWYRESNFWDVVPKLLGTKAFTHLVLLSPTSDLTNLLGAGVPEAQHGEHAQQSARNMFHTMERAINTSPSLERVTIFEMFPRSDSIRLSALATIYNTTLKELVASSPLSRKITVVGHPSLTITTEPKRQAMFGLLSSTRCDGIHFRGVEGSQAVTDSIIKGLTATGAPATLPGGWSVQGRQGAATSPATTATYSSVVTGNRFQVLNY